MPQTRQHDGKPDINQVSKEDLMRVPMQRLMRHVIKWKVQPQYRSRSWRNTILSARQEIVRLQRRMPSLNRRIIEVDWDELVELARLEAEGETNLDISPLTLTWQEVFEDAHTL